MSADNKSRPTRDECEPLTGEELQRLLDPNVRLRADAYILNELCGRAFATITDLKNKLDSYEQAIAESVSGDGGYAAHHQRIQEIAEFRSQVADLQRDKERLDWLEAYVSDGGKDGLVTQLHPNRGNSENLREAIDAARGEQLAKEGTAE